VKTVIAIIIACLLTSAALADEPTFESVQEEFRQKAVSILSESEEASPTDIAAKIAEISEIANATFGAHPDLMKKEAANRFKNLPVFPASRLDDFVEHKSSKQFPILQSDAGLVWATLAWEPAQLAYIAKTSVLYRTLKIDHFGSRGLANSYCPDKIYRLGEGEYPDLVVDSLGDLFLVDVEMTEAGYCKPVSVKWMKALAGDVKEIRNLIPAAAGMTLSDMDMLAMSPTTPNPSDVESKTLTLMLLSLKVRDDEKSRKEFRHLTAGVAKPSQLAEEIYRLVKGSGKLRFALGPVTMIHSDRITDFTCAVEGDKATGTVTFSVPELFEGQVNYVAQRRDGKWKIEEFMMPLHEIHIAVADNGNWVQK